MVFSIVWLKPASEVVVLQAVEMPRRVRAINKRATFQFLGIFHFIALEFGCVLLLDLYQRRLPNGDVQHIATFLVCRIETLIFVLQIHFGLLKLIAFEKFLQMAAASLRGEIAEAAIKDLLVLVRRITIIVFQLSIK
mmetsp:Transcript_26950/g.70916  ORF Transcript_26950/g.70916 Transcript_26950/m.70916 type:complete len:137 (-) Transcript_26950:38-448(-)